MPDDTRSIGKTETLPRYRQRADRTDIMENTAKPSKGFNWFKLLGILALIGVLVAVGRIVLRVFREKPETDTDSHEAA